MEIAPELPVGPWHGEGVCARSERENRHRSRRVTVGPPERREGEVARVAGDRQRTCLMVGGEHDERVSAETALRISLVTEVVARDRLWARAHEIAAIVAAKPSVATQGSVRSIWESQDSPPSEALKWGFQYAMLGNAVGALDRSKQGKAKWALR